MFAWKSSCPQRWPQGKFTLALADCHFDGPKNLSDGGKMWGNLSRHTWITWPPGPKLDPEPERERTWRESNFRYPKYHKHVFVDSAGFVPLSLQVKLQNQASQFRGNGPIRRQRQVTQNVKPKQFLATLQHAGMNFLEKFGPFSVSANHGLDLFLFCSWGASRKNVSPLWGAN